MVHPAKVSSASASLQELPPPGNAPPDQILQASPPAQRLEKKLTSPNKGACRDRRPTRDKADLDEPYTLSSGSKREAFVFPWPPWLRQRSPSSSPDRLRAAYTTPHKHHRSQGRSTERREEPIYVYAVLSRPYHRLIQRIRAIGVEGLSHGTIGSFFVFNLCDSPIVITLVFLMFICNPLLACPALSFVSSHFKSSLFSASNMVSSAYLKVNVILPISNQPAPKSNAALLYVLYITEVNQIERLCIFRIFLKTSPLP